jgi:hypothetical protein
MNSSSRPTGRRQSLQRWRLLPFGTRFRRLRHRGVLHVFGHTASPAVGPHRRSRRGKLDCRQRLADAWQDSTPTAATCVRSRPVRNMTQFSGTISTTLRSVQTNRHPRRRAAQSQGISAAKVIMRFVRPWAPTRSSPVAALPGADAHHGQRGNLPALLRVDLTQSFIQECLPRNDVFLGRPNRRKSPIQH